jgi:hypothetical protein
VVEEVVVSMLFIVLLLLGPSMLLMLLVVGFCGISGWRIACIIVACDVDDIDDDDAAGLLFWVLWFPLVVALSDVVVIQLVSFLLVDVIGMPNVR